MNEPSPDRILRSIWSGDQLHAPQCCECKNAIAGDSVLARTFRIRSLESNRNGARAWSEEVDVPKLSDSILIFHRHLECLLQHTTYVAISHVWNSEVAELQYTANVDTEAIYSVVDIVRERPIHFYRALKDQIRDLNASNDFDVWYDYIAVPQWQPEIKSRIIGSIPEIFNRARYTILDLEDVEPAWVESMRHGENMVTRAYGISDICNARYFSRVWTAMEFSKSPNVWPMLKGYQLVKRDPKHKTIVEELKYAWSGQHEEHEKDLEVYVGIGNNLVPWQLGGIEIIRDLQLSGNHAAFGSVHDVLSKRCVTILRDHFHALLAILRIPLSESDLNENYEQAMLEVAKACLKRGDHSPLLMAPYSVFPDQSEGAVRSWGYSDFRSFAIGFEEYPATQENVEFHADNPVIEAEHIGEVCQDHGGYWGWEDDIGSMYWLLRWSYETTGLDMEAIAKAIGERLFGHPASEILAHLHKTRTFDAVKENLAMLFDDDTATDATTVDETIEKAREVARSMGLTGNTLKNEVGSKHSPIDFMSNHGYTVHLGEALVMRIVNVRCKHCSNEFIIRISAYSGDGQTVMGAQAYRFPGLKYGATLRGGTGILLQSGGEIVGRFLWATSTCDCDKLEKVEVKLESVPLPQPNTSVYGLDKSRSSYYLVGRGEKVEWN